MVGAAETSVLGLTVGNHGLNSFWKTATNKLYHCRYSVVTKNTILSGKHLGILLWN